MILQMLRRWWHKFFGKPEEPVLETTPDRLRERLEGFEKRVEPRVPRTGIRSTDGGMRKLSRHRSGRLYDRRSGFDPNKRMVDIEDNQTRKRRKKSGWAEDKGKRRKLQG